MAIYSLYQRTSLFQEWIGGEYTVPAEMLEKFILDPTGFIRSICGKRLKAGLTQEIWRLEFMPVRGIKSAGTVSLQSAINYELSAIDCRNDLNGKHDWVVEFF